MSRLLKFWQLTRREKLFLCEAGTLFLISNLCVKTIAFRHIHRFLRACRSDRKQNAPACGDDIKLVNLSLSRIANLLPWKSLCLSRSIAAVIMLRRRGIPAAIIAGVKFTEDSSLHAHAWVLIGNGAPNEISETSEFTPVVRFG